MRALQENIGTPTDFSPERGRCRILFCSIPQAWQLTTGEGPFVLPSEEMAQLWFN